MQKHEPHASLYDQGIAVGYSDVVRDMLIFRFRDEVFEFPTLQVPLSSRHFNGYFLVAKIEDLRQLAKAT